jgi:hypothetical protein
MPTIAMVASRSPMTADIYNYRKISHVVKALMIQNENSNFRIVMVVDKGLQALTFSSTFL